MLDIYFWFVSRYGWMQEPKSSFPTPSAWAALLLLEVTIPTTTTATGNSIHARRGRIKLSISNQQKQMVLK